MIDTGQAQKQRDSWEPADDYHQAMPPASNAGLINRLKEALPLIKQMVPGLKPKGGGELAGPCLKCGGTDRFYVRPDGSFGCRQCNPKGGDVVDFHMWVNGTDLHGLADVWLTDRQPEEKSGRENFPHPKKPKAPAIEANLAKIYSYTDENGAELFQVCRYESEGCEKAFRQRHHNGNVYVGNLKGVRRVLYRLPKVIKSDCIIITEGEKDVDNLAGFDFTATTSPMGASNWRPEYATYLKGKHVAVIPDNDEAGQTYVDKILPTLQGVAASIRVVKVPVGKDVSDWIQAGATKEQIIAAIDAAPEYVPEPAEKPGGYLKDALFTVGEFRKIKVPPRTYHLFPWWWSGSYGVIAGQRGVGKTWFALGALDAITRGEKFGPWECNEPVPCLFIEGEMPMSDDQERIDLMNLSSKRQAPLYILSDAYVCEVLKRPSINLGNPETRQYLRDLILSKGIKVVVFDNVASLTPGIDENSKMEWDEINQWLLGLRYAGVSPWLIHHLGKNGDQRGTSGREDNIDLSVKLLKPNDYQETDGARFIVSFPKKRIAHKFLPLIADLEMQYRPDDNGQHVWIISNPKKDMMLEVLFHLTNGLGNNETANLLDTSRGNVSKMRKKLDKAGLIDPGNILTVEGKNELMKAGFDV